MKRDLNLLSLTGADDDLFLCRLVAGERYLQNIGPYRYLQGKPVRAIRDGAYGGTDAFDEDGGIKRGVFVSGLGTNHTVDFARELSGEPRGGAECEQWCCGQFE